MFISICYFALCILFQMFGLIKNMLGFLFSVGCLLITVDFSLRLSFLFHCEPCEIGTLSLVMKLIILIHVSCLLLQSRMKDHVKMGTKL